MKKGLILTTALAMALGVGVAVGAHRAEAREVKAAGEVTVFCKVTQNWWLYNESGDPAAVGVHYWGGASTGTTWPGVRMSETTETHVWKLNVPADITGLIFTRVNAGTGAVSDWGAKTGDLTLPTDGKNLYTVTSESAVWGNPGVTGTWSAYTEDVPATDGYYVVGTRSNWKFAGATKMDAGQGTDKAQLLQYEGLANEEFKVRSYLEGVARWYGDTNYQVGENNKKVNIYINQSNELYVEDYHEPDFPDEDGYYIVGTKTNWKFDGATKMDAGDEQNDAILLRYNAEEGEEFKARSYFDGVEAWYGVGEHSDNYVSDADKEVDIYLSKDGHIYVFDYVEPDVPDEEGYYIKGSAIGWRYETAVKMTNVDNGNVAEYYELSVAVGDEIRVCSYYTDRTPYEQWSEVGDDFDPDDPESIGYKSENNFKFKIAGSYDIYAKYEDKDDDGNAEFYFYVATHVERVIVTLAGKQFSGKQYSGEVTLARPEVIAGQPYTVPSIPMEGYVQLGAYTDFACTTPFVDGTVIESNTMLHIVYMKLGFYLAGGDDPTFSVENATYLPGDGQNKTAGAVVVPNTASEEHPYKVKPLEYVADAGEGHPGWSAIFYEMGHEEQPAFVSIDNDGNFAFTIEGTYAFYVNNENKVWFNGGEYAFHARFLEEVGGTCNAQGGTNLTTLKAVWGEMETAFNALSEDEIAAIREVGFNGGDEHSTDDRLKVIAMYHYIVWKYGTAEFKDFMFGQNNIAPHPTTSTPISVDNSQSNNANILIIIVAAISVVSLAALIVIKKRKHN